MHVCVTKLRHQKHKINCYKSLSMQFHVRRYKLGYWNDLLLCIEHKNYTIAELQVGIFVHYYPPYKAVMTFFSVFESLQRKRLGHFLFLFYPDTFL